MDPVTSPTVKPTLTEKVPDHVKQLPATEHVIAKPGPKIMKQDVTQQTPTYTDPIYRPHPKPMNHPHKYIQGKQRIWILTHQNKTSTHILKKIAHIKKV